MTSLTGTTGTVEVREHASEQAEIRWVVERLSTLPAGLTAAVLARTNYIALQARQAAIDSGLPVALPPRQPDHEERSKVLVLLSALLDPHSEAACERWWRLTMSAGDANRRKLSALAQGMSLCQTSPVYPPGTIAAIRDVPRLLAQKGVGMEMISVVSDALAGLPEPSIAALLAHLWQPVEPEPGTGGIVFSTVHNFKGREADCVLVLGLEEGTFPLLRKNADIEEEKRLCYVAVTRCKDALHLSFARRRKPEFGPAQDMHPSRFLAEMLP